MIHVNRSWAATSSRCSGIPTVAVWADFGGTAPRGAGSALPVALLKSLLHQCHPFPSNVLILGERHVIVTALPQLSIPELAIETSVLTRCQKRNSG